MLLYINGQKHTVLPAKTSSTDSLIVFLLAEELRLPELSFLGIPSAKSALEESDMSRFESRPSLDYLSLSLPSFEHSDKPFTHTSLQIYFSHSRLVFVCDTPYVFDSFILWLEQRLSTESVSPGAALCRFCLILTDDDPPRLMSVEEEIAELEDSLTQTKDMNYSQKISALRKRLLNLKRYYETLYDALEDMDENENKLLGESDLRTLRLAINRADRLFRSVMNLRDYVTQVRESYQAELDISMNKVMKLFTVITAIFMPLTLLVGWYGMNLMMPEFSWAGGYPTVIGISLAIIVLCIAYFKRNKWF